ncbi:MAG: DUF6249 domain-containing protein [Steroidobacteraceae bacterium]
MRPDIIGVFIPIVAIVMGIGLAMLETVASHRRRSQALEQRHRERLAAIDKGIELPPDANDPEAQLELAKAMRKPRYLLRGLVLTGIGGALVFLWQGPADDTIRSLGWIVAVIGLATLAYYAIEGRKEKQPELPGQPADLLRGEERRR